MELSEKRRSEVYNAIYEPIFKLRIENRDRNGLPEKYLDDELFAMTETIWRDICKALKVKDP